MNMVALPVMIPFATAVLLLAAPLKWHLKLSILSGLGLLAVHLLLTRQSIYESQVLVLTFGGWSPVVGISWIVDGLSALMLLLTSILSLAALTYSMGIHANAVSRRFYFVTHQFLLVGVNGSFVTGDLFNLFVCFEMMLLASFVQISMQYSADNQRHVIPYVLVNMVASMILLTGVGFVYAGAGTVNLATIGRLGASGEMSSIFWLGMSLALLVAAVKAALAPVFFWLPDSYPAAPIPVAAFFGGVLTKVGVYVLYRLVPMLSPLMLTEFQNSMIIISVTTMAAGVIGALGSNSIRGVLSFHIVSQVGYMALGLALLTKGALAAGVFYIAHNMIVKTALFFAAGIVEQIAGSGRLGAIRGLWNSQPLLALAFFVPAMAIAGIPPLSGFWGKLFLLQEAITSESWFSVAAIVGVSLLTLASMLKIWNSTFWGAPSAADVIAPPRIATFVAVLSLAAGSVIMGVLANPIYEMTTAIADQIHSPNIYIDSVLGSLMAVDGPAIAGENP